jgi:uncharacterized protein (TIGR02246 family)
MSAATPDDVMQAWTDAYHAHDLDAMMDLFEPDAVWVSQEGKVASGLDAIRDVFSGFMKLDAGFEPQAPDVVQADGVALLSSTWRLHGPSVDITARTADVLRRQSDGRWLYVIDAPFGGGS